MSELLALGISYRTAPVALRERLAFTPTGARAFAKLTLESPEVHEVVVLSTCNRTEVYLVVGDPLRAEGDVLRCSPATPASARPRSPRRSTRRATATPRDSSTASPPGSTR